MGSWVGPAQSCSDSLVSGSTSLLDLDLAIIEDAYHQAEYMARLQRQRTAGGRSGRSPVVSLIELRNPLNVVV